MQNPCSIDSRVSATILFCFIFFSCFPGHLLSAVVTLRSIKLYRTHDWFKPTVYFHCHGENKTILPDVQEKNVLYTFKGVESWQPLTELVSEKCKRCGIYEDNLVRGDDSFDEWELCPADFTKPDGNYTHVKENEFNATFLCPGCLSLVGGQPPPAVFGSNAERKKEFPYVSVILSSVAASIVVIAALVVGYKYWQKRKRHQEQARFLKLFEESDEMEDELGLHDVI